jgi:hypothetical protein
MKVILFQNILISELNNPFMRVKKKYLPLWFLLMITFHSASPQSSPTLSGEIIQPSTGLKGSQFFINEWVKGDIFFHDGTRVTDKKLRYNGYTEEVLWLHEGSNQVVLIDRNLIEKFSLYLPDNPEPLVFEKMPLKSAFQQGTGDVFAHSLYKDTISLFAIRQVVKKRDVIEKRGNARGLFTEIEPKHIYFLILPCERVAIIGKSRRKSFYRAFPQFRDEIRSAFTGTRNRIRDENEMVEAVRLINEIIAR